MYIDREEWDPLKQSPKNIYKKKSKRVNEQLNRIRVGLHEYLIRHADKTISHAKIQAYIYRIGKQKNKYAKGTLLAYMTDYIESKAHIVSPTTLKRYHVFLKLIARFEGYSMKRYTLKEVCASYVRQFLKFGKLEGYSTSTLYRTIHFVRTILLFLEKRGVRTYFYELDLPKMSKKGKITTLSEKELMRIKQTEVGSNLRAAKDWLIISCYTGQRISDFINFSTDQLQVIEGRTCISFEQQKTKKSILLPLHPTVMHILKRNNNKFPPKISAQSYNKQIKEIARIAGLDIEINLRRREQHRVVSISGPKWQAMTSHIGRRSFASNFYGKIPTALLMEATGHSSERMFLRYVNQVDTQRTVALSKYLEEVYQTRTQLI